MQDVDVGSALIPQPRAVGPHGYSFEYHTVQLTDIEVLTVEDKQGRQAPSALKLHGETLQQTPRFWDSLFARYGIGGNIFKYYDYPETFARIAAREDDVRLRVCVERNEKGHGVMLAASNPARPVVAYDQLVEILSAYGGDQIRYSGGIVESIHMPRVGVTPFNIGGDSFANRFLLAAAIDGYGAPKIYLSLLREVCANGMVAWVKGFRSDLSLGKGNDDVAFAVTRALDGFNHDEGFAALRQRVEAAQTSWASVAEAMQLYKLLLRLHARKELSLNLQPTAANAPAIRRWLDLSVEAELAGRPGARLIAEAGVEAAEAAAQLVGSPMLRAFHAMTGDVQQTYGLANMDALSVKRQRTLPIKCRVYDLLNFISELSTHHAAPPVARTLNGMLGTLVEGEYDLEASATTMPEFDDFLIEGSALRAARQNAAAEALTAEVVAA